MAGGLLLLVTGCTDRPEPTEVSIAQADVTAKTEALADAEAEAADTAEAFCAASSTYITALDRYGDVLNQTATTVGDVRVAGEDLADPAAETQDAAQAAVDARAALAQAQADLADAEATLAAAQAAEAGQPAPETTSGDTNPTASAAPASVTRVQQAEAEFADARAGITDETPLPQAAEQFNAAAVALEIAWMRLFADSGCLSDEQQVQASATVSAYTVALQQSLSDAGYYAGEIDGIYGPQTVAAVRALQEANGLPETGTMDKASEAALRSTLEALGGAAAQAAAASTAALQQTLKLAGYWDGPVDGQWTDALTAAVGALQTDLGVPVTGTVDAATIAAFQSALAAAGEEPTPEPSPTESTDG
ncbi:peptidoglycan-binding protein [Cellulomonas humilata]|uniref:Peptidoglycan-binding protein n=2 Tax=Cellulomonas humilata TaxID=144055 RepID=A0A7Y6A4N1_9CELL|nr:peptidoglycan-binding protein [Cellulomonas humilata]